MKANHTKLFEDFSDDLGGFDVITGKFLFGFYFSIALVLVGMVIPNTTIGLGKVNWF